MDAVHVFLVCWASLENLPWLFHQRTCMPSLSKPSRSQSLLCQESASTTHFCCLGKCPRERLPALSVLIKCFCFHLRKGETFLQKNWQLRGARGDGCILKKSLGSRAPSWGPGGPSFLRLPTQSHSHSACLPCARRDAVC